MWAREHQLADGKGPGINAIGREIKEHTAARRGFESATAQVVFNVVRIASAIAVPLLALMLVPRRSLPLFALALILSFVIGLILPQAFLNHRAATRQEHLRRAIRIHSIFLSCASKQG